MNFSQLLKSAVLFISMTALLACRPPTAEEKAQLQTNQSNGAVMLDSVNTVLEVTKAAYLGTTLTDANKQLMVASIRLNCTNTVTLDNTNTIQAATISGAACPISLTYTKSIVGNTTTIESRFSVRDAVFKTYIDVTAWEIKGSKLAYYSNVFSITRFQTNMTINLNSQTRGAITATVNDAETSTLTGKFSFIRTINYSVGTTTLKYTYSVVRVGTTMTTTYQKNGLNISAQEFDDVNNNLSFF